VKIRRRVEDINQGVQWGLEVLWDRKILGNQSFSKRMLIKNLEKASTTQTTIKWALSLTMKTFNL